MPEGSDLNYHGCNFEMAAVDAAEWRWFPVVAVYVAELDFSKERVGDVCRVFEEKWGEKIGIG